MSSVDELADTDQLEALDFEPVIPCAWPNHENSNGCVPEQPAAWRIIMMHSGPTCEPRHWVVCDARYQHALAAAQAMFAPGPCPKCGKSHPFVVICGRCGAPLRSPADLVALVGEV